MNPRKTELVSIVVPCRNEEGLIADCIASMLAFDLPEHIQIEVLVLDGLSEDQTVIKLRSIMKKDARVKLFTNPGKIQSTAINIALKEAQGEWILRLDAHSTYPQNYLKLCYETMLRTGADNVGGIVISTARNNRYGANLVQAITTHKFGVGNSGFRTGMKAGAADTVPYGFFRKSIFDTIGLFDERLVRAQDYEYNCRIIKSGGTVWLNPEIQLVYYNQPSLWLFLKKQLLQDAKNIFSEKVLLENDAFIIPAIGTKTGVFGSQRFFNNKPRRPHSGVDYANAIGTDIKAFASGRVVLVGDFYFNGKTILIDHGQGLMSIYIHLNDIKVKTGERVQQGLVIGKMGASGRATGPHLHFGVYLNGVAVNPEVFYDK